MDIVNAWQVNKDDSEFAIISIRKDPAATLSALTVTERKIAERLLLGESNKEIAQGRGTSMRTVANQVASIFRKLGVCSRAELTAHVTRTHLGPAIGSSLSRPAADDQHDIPERVEQPRGLPGTDDGPAAPSARAPDGQAGVFNPQTVADDNTGDVNHESD